jgi:AAA domain
MSPSINPHQAYQAGLAELARASGAPHGFLSLDRVSPRQVEWLWPGWIPRGRVTLLDGDPGLGKSTLLLDLAARLSTGHEMPDGAPVEAGAVILLAGEDDLEETVRPRLEAAGADLARCHCLASVLHEGTKLPPRLPGDLPILEQHVLETGARLLVVDPFLAFLDDAVDSYREQSIRACLQQLGELCVRQRLACVLVRHLTKYGSQRAIYRGGGSIAIMAAARAALLLAADPADPTNRVLAVSKTNLAQTPPSLGLGFEAVDGRVSRAVWKGTSPESADSLLGRVPDAREQTRLEEAVKLLKKILYTNEPRPATEVYREAATAGITPTTLRRAKERLAVRSVRIPWADPPQWGWVLRKGRRLESNIINPGELERALEVRKKS